MDVRRHPRREHSTKLLALSGAPGTGDQTRRGRGMLVTTQQIAADVGRDLLVAGGSAVDAIVAAAFALCVVDPSNCGIGGYGGFLVYAPAGDEPARSRVQHVDALTSRPVAASPSREVSGRSCAAGSASRLRRSCRGSSRPMPGSAGGREQRCSSRPFGWPATVSRSVPISPGRSSSTSRMVARAGAATSTRFSTPTASRSRRGSTLIQQRPRRHARDDSRRRRRRRPERSDRGGDLRERVASGGVLTPDDLAQDHVSVGRPATATFAGATVYGPSPAVSGTGILFPALDEIDPACWAPTGARDTWPRSPTAFGARGRCGSRTCGCAREPSPHHAPLRRGPDRDLATLTFTHGPGSDRI